jgi:hypothetical protein
MHRWFIVLLLVGVVFFARRRLLAASETAATSVADNLTRLSPASATWAGGGPAGMNLTGMDKGVVSGLGKTALHTGYVGGAAAVGTASVVGGGIGRYVGNRMRDKRSQRYSFNNLERMERRRESPKYKFSAEPTPGLPKGNGPKASGPSGRGGRSPAPGGRPSGNGHAGGRSTVPSGGQPSGGRSSTPLMDEHLHQQGYRSWGGGGGDHSGGSGGGGGGHHGADASGGHEFSMPGEYERSASISWEHRAPRSFRPKVSDLWHPKRFVKRPFEAANDRRRFNRNKRRFQHMTGSRETYGLRVGWRGGAPWKGGHPRVSRSTTPSRNKQNDWRSFEWK